jgi:hypothetical protein
MTYRIAELAKLAQELGFEITQLTERRVDLLVSEGCVLVFWNHQADGDDDLVGFEGTPWHDHGTVVLMTGDQTFINCDELDTLIGLSTGEIVIITELFHGETRDRWLAHKNEPLALKHIRLGEELRVATATATAQPARHK